MKIDSSSWGTFRIDDIFIIRNGKGITKEEIENNPGDFIAVQSGEENNGCIGKINKQYVVSKQYTICENPCLTVARSGSAGFVSYQKYGCVVGDSAKILELKETSEITDNVMIFLQGILTMLRFKYTYGRKVAYDKYASEIIKLPMCVDGTPDWECMESYMKTLHYKPLTTKNKKETIIPLHPADWKKFRVGDLFVQERGAEAAPNQNEDGEVPIINETETNNGFVRNVVPTKVFAGNAITISINFARNVFYQPTDFCASVNIAIIRNKNLNAFNGLFIASVLRINNLKYSYGYKISKDKIDNTILKLPATPFGEPDWQFMESYIKSLPYGDRI